MRYVRGVLSILLMLIISGCMYKPSSQYARGVVGETMSTQVVISMIDPENTVIIKDAVDAAVIERFKSSLTDRSKASTHLKITLQNVSFSPLQYDTNGYIISYRTTVNLSIARYSKNFSKTYSAKGTYDFAIEPNAIISDQARFDAIKFGSQKAIDSFVAQVAAEGVRKREGKIDKPVEAEKKLPEGEPSIQGYGKQNRQY